MRNELLAAIRARVARARETGDPAPVLDPDATLEVSALVAFLSANGSGPDAEACHEIGWLCWLRVLALPVEEVEEDLECAVIAFRSVFAADPSSVPEPLHEYYTQQGVSAMPPEDDLLIPEDLVLGGEDGPHPDHTDRETLADSDPADLTDHGVVFMEWYERAGDLEALQGALEQFRSALALVPSDHPKWDLCMSNLLSALASWYDDFGEVDALREMVAVLREGARVDPSRRAFLSTALFTLSNHIGDIEALREAVDVRRALVGDTADAATRADHLNELGGMARKLYESTGEAETLDEAVTAFRASVRTTPSGDPELPGRLTGLGGILQALFERTGDPDVLREAIDTGHRALAAFPQEHPHRGMCLANLGVSLRTSFERTGDLAVLSEAVDAHRASLAATPDDHPARAGRLLNLGNTLRTLADRTGDPQALSGAVQAGAAALELINDDHPDRARYLSSLANSLYALAGRTEDPRHWAEAADLSRAAVAATPEGHAFRPRNLNNLAVGLTLQFRHTGDPATLREAVAAGRAAVAASHDNWSELPGYLCVLGSALVLLHRHTGDESARDEAQAVLKRATAHPAATVEDRISAERSLARICPPEAALGAIETVVSLLPLVAPRDLRRADREHQLGEEAGIAGQVAATALAAGRPQRAVELLEQSRGLLLREDMDSRTEVDRLRAHAPDLVDEFVRLRDDLARLDPTPTPGSEGDRTIADRRRAAAAAWDGLLDRVHARPGLAGFLAPPSIDELRRQADAGPIVLVTTDRDRCDALIVTGDTARPVRHVPLPALTEQAAYEQGDRFLAARRAAVTAPDASGRRRAEAELHDVLGWLWDTTAAPILTALGHTAAPEDGWPRIWWCSVGVMAYLPLHAAGHHHDLLTDTPPRTVMDRVVSSYTPTIRALAYARRNPAPSSPEARPALIVAMPETPDAPPLPGADDEAHRVSRLLTEPTILRSRHATRQAVLSALPRHSVAHFACHATSGWDAPDAGRLLLHDHSASPLTVAEISRLDLAGADLAYLSACGTSDTHPRLVDEAVHITAAFQLAGFRATIGTLWPINDRVATQAAEEIYTELTGEGTRPPDAARAAHALHHALHRLRATYLDAPTLWAGQIHAGI
ncbi:CHAT domain-containing protein [Actinomadura fibrosa]|uniref:CHAT domain-containing protein n=1 Tax=Actinomadura fibrosa TaxID=111802 RepID=A0ABW2XQZ2_9ACTN|nr:CHAT domain-containing protein [Actinomadura fibrosa]